MGNAITKTKWVQHVVTKYQGFSCEQKFKLAKTSCYRDTKKWLNLNSTTQNQLVSTRPAEKSSVATTASYVTTATAVEGQNDDHDADGIEFVDDRPRRKPRQMTLRYVGILDYCDEGRAKITTNSICHFLVDTATAFAVVESYFSST